MQVEISEEAIARIVLGANAGEYQLYFETEKGAYPLRLRILKDGDGIRFLAERPGIITREVTLTLEEIFNHIPRLTKVLFELESRL